MATQQQALVITAAGNLPEFQEIPVPQLQESQPIALYSVQLAPDSTMHPAHPPLCSAFSPQPKGHTGESESGGVESYRSARANVTDRNITGGEEPSALKDEDEADNSYDYDVRCAMYARLCNRLQA